MPKLGLGLSLAEPRPILVAYDSDALTYLNAVEAADGQSLETSVKIAINEFIKGCKADGIWTSIVACCIMAGARTVAGAITPLVGNAPTNNNFVSGDYSRTLGLLGNGTNKYLATGYNNNDTTNFPQNNSHMSCFVSESQTDVNGTLVGTATGLGNRFRIGYSSATNISAVNRSSLASTLNFAPLGFQCHSRNSSTGWSRRFYYSGGFEDSNVSSNSGSPNNELLGVFATGAGGAATTTSARMSFYSIGKSLSIPNLDTRVTTLMSALSSALA